MQTKLTSVSSSTLVGGVYLLLALTIAANLTTPIGQFLQDLTGLPLDVLISFILALVMGGAGLYMTFREPRGNRFKIFASPLMFLSLTTALIFIYQGGFQAAMSPLLFVLAGLIMRDFESDAEKQNCQDYAESKRLEAEDWRIRYEALKAEKVSADATL